MIVIQVDFPASRNGSSFLLRGVNTLSPNSLKGISGIYLIQDNIIGRNFGASSKSVLYYVLINLILG